MVFGVLGLLEFYLRAYGEPVEGIKPSMLNSVYALSDWDPEKREKMVS